MKCFFILFLLVSSSVFGQSIKRQLYAYNESWSMERLIQTDSLVYANDMKSVTIHTGKNTVVLKSEEIPGETTKAIDRETDWKQPCKSTDAVLQPIQRFFQVDCLSDFIQNSGEHNTIFMKEKLIAVTVWCSRNPSSNNCFPVISSTP